MQKLFRDISYKISKLITRSYSTSFSIAVSYLGPETRQAIYSIYGFVRLADEIVDSFLDYDREKLLGLFERDYYEAYQNGISINPPLNAFVDTVRKYRIPDSLVRDFLKSMKTDLYKSDYNTKNETDEYVYGSAEVVGLMCLMVFVKGDERGYAELREPARKLGAAFQKVNFLRDLKDDTVLLNRKYFHQMAVDKYNEEVKKEIVNDIMEDFRSALPGIRKLPEDSKIGVLIAYYYFLALLKKIDRTPAKIHFAKRIRVPDLIKILILGKAVVISKLRLI